MSFIDWYYVLEAFAAKKKREREERKAPETMRRLAASPYRHSDEEPPFATESVEERFVVGFRSRDGTEFICRIVAVFEASARFMLTEAARDEVFACLSDRIRRHGRWNGATEILAVIRDYIEAICLGVRRTPDEVMACLPDGVILAYVRLISVTVDSGAGRPITFRFDR